MSFVCCSNNFMNQCVIVMTMAGMPYCMVSYLLTLCLIRSYADWFMFSLYGVKVWWTQ